jgi:signal transduction histidine kinase
MQFGGMYFASQKLLTGLSDLHQSIISVTRVRQLRQLLTSQQEFEKKVATNPLSKDELIIFGDIKEQVKSAFKANLELSQQNPEVYQLIAEADRILDPLNNRSLAVTQGDVKTTFLVVDQLFLEAQEQLGKVQLVLMDQSNKIFSQLYSSRQTPLIVGVLLSVIFLIFALAMGASLIDKINKPIKNLTGAITDLMGSNISVRANISEADEVGVLAHAFNKMADSLSERISERDKINQELIEARDAAETANLAKSAFLANMSHEIRTPLGALMGFADLVVDPRIRPAEKASFVAAIKRNGELLSSIINDILDLSKIEADKVHIETVEVALSEILIDTKSILDLQAQNKGIDLKIQVDENVPEKIKTDPLRLRQILINIIGNAVKFTSSGAVDVKVQQGPYKNGHQLLAFKVSDTGPGISSDQIGKLFAPFSQIDVTSKRKFGGTGLGLVLSKRFAHLLGGDVVLSESAPGQGSTFTITIDPGTHQFVRSELGQEIKLTGTRDDERRLEGINILLADDSLDNQVVVSNFLKLAGVSVDLASNGKEAIEKTKTRHYDVLLMDLQMPIMDGYEATAELRKEGYQGKIVAITAHALADDRRRCLQNGFDDHISKPVNRSTLIEVVASLSSPAKS